MKGLKDTLDVMGFETYYSELLPESPAARRRRPAERLRTFIRGRRPPIRHVTRGVFVSRFCGIDADSRYWRYWEGEHRIHTEIGG